MVCRHCKRMIPDDSLFCPVCGQNLSAPCQDPMNGEKMDQPRENGTQGGRGKAAIREEQLRELLISLKKRQEVEQRAEKKKKIYKWAGILAAILLIVAWGWI